MGSLQASDRTLAMQDLGYELPRISLLRRWVNKGKSEGPEPRRTPARLVVLEGNILEVFILEVGVLVDVETLRCGACHPEFLYVSGTERRIQETEQRVLCPQILCNLLVPVVQDACQVLDLAGVGLLPETIRIPTLCQMLA